MPPLTLVNVATAILGGIVGGSVWYFLIRPWADKLLDRILDKYW